MNKILYLHIYYERNKYICKTMYFKNSLKTTFLYMQGSRDILCCAHVLCPAWKVSLRNTFYKYTSSKYISLHVECEVVWRLISRHWTLCVQRWVTAMLLIYIVSMSFTACLASGRFLILSCQLLQDVFKWWFVQSILWLSSAPCSAVSRHRFSASGVQWSTRVRADRTSPWHWFFCYAHQCIFWSSLSINLTC